MTSVTAKCQVWEGRALPGEGYELFILDQFGHHRITKVDGRDLNLKKNDFSRGALCRVPQYFRVVSSHKISRFSKLGSLREENA